MRNNGNASGAKRTRWGVALVAALALVMAIAFAACAQPPASSGASSPSGSSAQSASAGASSDAESDSAPSADPVSAAASTTGAPSEGAADGASSDEAKPRYEEGVVLVQPAPDATADAIAAAIEGASVLDDSDGLVKLKLPAGMAVEEAVEVLEDTELVESAQPNFLYELQKSAAPSSLVGQLAPLSAVPFSTQATATDDPYLDDQWAIEFMNVAQAWDTARADGSASGAKVGVAVIDASFQATHPDLKPNLIGCYNAVTKSTAESSVMGGADDYHGTHVAGIVSGRANNGVGVAGISYNAPLLLVRAFDSGGSSSTEYLTRSINYVVGKAKANNIRVISMSVGARWNKDVTDVVNAASGDLAVLRAIDAAYDAGIVMVCSAGNEGKAIANYPSDYEKVVSVMNLMPNARGGAYTASTVVCRANGEVAQKCGIAGDAEMSYPDSSYNPKGSYLKDLSAPGSTIVSTWTRSLYGYESGTSMSAPHVAGALALIFSAKPGLTPDQATSLLFSTARDITYSVSGESAGKGWDRFTGYGSPNVQAAVGAQHAYYLSGKTSMKKGAARTFSVKGTPSQSWRWTSSNTNVATVDSAGKVTATGPGTAIITATSTQNSSYKAQQTVSVYNPKLTGDSSVKVGASTKLTLTCQEETGWKFSSSDKSIATVGSTTGKVKGKKAGTVKITATATAHPSVKVSKKVRVVKGYLSAAKVTLSKKAYTYNGKAKKPGVTVKLGGKKLKRGTHFTVKYTANKKAGTAKVTLKAKGAYAGKKVVKFKIKKASVAKAKVKLAKRVYAYDGTAKEPAVSVKVGARKLKRGTDYTVRYADNTYVGTAKAIVVGKGNYKGKIAKAFTIE